MAEKNMKDKEKSKDDTGREFKDTQQEVMIDLKLKTDAFLKKLKDQNRKRQVSFGNM